MMNLVGDEYTDMQKQAISEFHNNPDKFIAELATALSIFAIAITRLQLNSLADLRDDKGKMH